MKIDIRNAKTEELKAVQDLNYALFESDRPHDPLLAMDWPYTEGEAYFRGAISGETGVCFVAEVEGKLVGYLVGSIKLGDFSYRPIKRTELENMFVKAEFRSQGIGAKLARAFLEWSCDNGAKRSFVQAYAPNEKAIAFYQKLGFVPYVLELETKLDS